MSKPLPPKIKFDKSLYDTILNEGVYSREDITYIRDVAKEKGYLTSREVIYSAIIIGADVSETHKPTIDIATDYFESKLRMVRAFRKRLGLDPIKKSR